ncbi:MAG: hypothetical protein M3P82_01545 [Bacteroidota bacterium]|nr:hypothetical protein [Bacteroidota bacterium]
MNDKRIDTSDFPRHIFWNYKENVFLNEDIVIRNVLLYGDIEDYKKLLKHISNDSLNKIVKQLEATGKNKKRINFIKKILL